MKISSMFGGTVSLPEWTPTWRVEPVETDRDELLRQIGEKVVERCDDLGWLRIDDYTYDQCPVCGRYDGEGHTEDCRLAELLTRYLEATDE